MKILHKKAGVEVVVIRWLVKFGKLVTSTQPCFSQHSSALARKGFVETMEKDKTKKNEELRYGGSMTSNINSLSRVETKPQGTTDICGYQTLPLNTTHSVLLTILLAILSTNIAFTAITICPFYQRIMIDKENIYKLEE
ncbi:hypothetical protein YC2023_055615 [Brassica napus]